MSDGTFGRVVEKGKFTLANDCAFALTGGRYARRPVNIKLAKAEWLCRNLDIKRGITGAANQQSPSPRRGNQPPPCPPIPASPDSFRR